LALQHKLKLAGHFPEVNINICAKKMIPFETAMFGRNLFARKQSQYLER
jgi:hypothetical protein